MFHIAICDDDVTEHSHLKQLFLQLSTRTTYSFQIEYFQSGEELLHRYAEMRDYSFEILILDIEMSGINGLETAKKIRRLPDRDVQIIFLTSYPEYMIDSFDVQTFQYLLKPISYERFECKMIMLCHYILSQTKQYLVARINREDIVLCCSNIIAITKEKRYLAKDHLEIMTVKELYIAKGVLSELSERLNQSFLLVHRSILVNMDHIRKFSAGSVVMTNGAEFPIGRSKMKAVKDAYNQFIIIQMKSKG